MQKRKQYNRVISCSSLYIVCSNTAGVFFIERGVNAREPQLSAAAAIILFLHVDNDDDDNNSSNVVCLLFVLVLRNI